MLVGFSNLVMEFPTDLEMAGYVDRVKPSEGKHDDLEVFCVYLESDSKSVAIVVFDVLGIPDGIPLRIGDIETIPVATHTHSAPKPSLVLDELKVYQDMATHLAMERKSVLEHLILKRCTTYRICDFRDRDENAVIPVNILEFRTKELEFAVLVYSCHPTVLGPENSLYSSDLAGALRRKAGEKLGIPVIYLNSCCGNISTHKTRRGRSFEELERLSTLFIENLDCFEEIDYTTKEFRFYRGILELEIINKNVENVKDERAVPGLKLLKSRKLNEDMKFIRTSVLELDALKLIFEPCELFHETCKRFDEETIIVNYANGYRPYLVPKNLKNTYEWVVSPYSEDSEEIFVEFIGSLLERGDSLDRSRT